MDVALAVVALIVAAVSLSAAINFGRSQTRLQAEIKTLRDDLQRTRDDVERTRGDLTLTQGGLSAARGELAAAQRELGELKALADAPAPPPLPRSRSDGLDDLRQQLRASHAEEEEDAASEG